MARPLREEGLLSNNSDDLPHNEISNINGSDYFRDRIIRKYLKKDMEDIDEREQPELAKINSFSAQDIIRIVGKYFNLRRKDRIVVRKGANLNARNIAMYLVARHCKKTDSLSMIASHFGVGINAISSNTIRCEEKFITNKAFQKQLQEINKLLHKNKNAKV